MKNIVYITVRIKAQMTLKAPTISPNKGDPDFVIEVKASIPTSRLKLSSLRKRICA